jgi:sporulation protein YlmC with PRC-barrel domain
MVISTMIKRLGMSMLIGIALGVLISEVSFVFLRDTARAPEEILLTIPAGTAEQVARGEQPPSIPADMVFVVGDTLIIQNDDDVDHKLGQLWIPANSNARLSLSEVENMAFECSFQPGNYFGLDVRQSLTLATRIYGILYAGVPLGILIAVYSFVIPSKKKENVPA